MPGGLRYAYKATSRWLAMKTGGRIGRKKDRAHALESLYAKAKGTHDVSAQAALKKRYMHLKEKMARKKKKK